MTDETLDDTANVLESFSAIEILKLLVEKISKLEQTVYNQDNVLMKSGLVKVNTPTPKISNNSEMPDGDTISKMSWEQINNMVSKMEGSA